MPLKIFVFLQAVAIILNVGMCLLYMPLCHEVARLTSEAAARLWLYAAAELEAGQMPLLATYGVPELTQRFYGRGSGAAWAMRCIAADDIFIARFEGKMLCSTVSLGQCGVLKGVVSEQWVTTGDIRLYAAPQYIRFALRLCVLGEILTFEAAQAGRLFLCWKVK